MPITSSFTVVFVVCLIVLYLLLFCRTVCKCQEKGHGFTGPSNLSMSRLHCCGTIISERHERRTHAHRNNDLQSLCPRNFTLQQRTVGNCQPRMAAFQEKSFIHSQHSGIHFTKRRNSSGTATRLSFFFTQSACCNLDFGSPAL